MALALEGRIVFPKIADLEALGSLTEGEVGYDDGENCLKVYNGTGWDPASLPTPVTNDQLLVVDTAANGKRKWADSGAIVRAKESFRAYRTSNGSAIASLASAILYTTEEWDDGACFDPTTGKFTAPTSGVYHFDFESLGSGTYATTTYLNAYLYKNGTIVEGGTRRVGTNSADKDSVNVSGDLKLAAGDTVEVRVSLSTGSWTAYGEASGVGTRFNGHKVSADYAGSLTTPKFNAWRSSNDSARASVASDLAFNQERYDTNSNWNGSTFTAPVAGKYHFAAEVLGAGSYATSTTLQLRIYKNGTAVVFGPIRRGTNNASEDYLTLHTDLDLAAGDTVSLRVFLGTGSWTTYGEASNAYSYFSGHLIRDDAAVPLEAAIRGSISTSGSGTINSGSGFTITRNGTGDVTVNFTTAFSAAPHVTLASDTHICRFFANPGTSSVRVILQNISAGAAAAAEGTFNFIAAGAR